MILTKEEQHRIRVYESTKEDAKVVVDVHGMKCAQAKRFINNIIAIGQTRFQLEIIHGYNHGTAIKDMISQELTNRRIVEKNADPCNRGVTYLQIA